MLPGDVPPGAAGEVTAGGALHWALRLTGFVHGERVRKAAAQGLKEELRV